MSAARRSKCFVITLAAFAMVVGCSSSPTTTDESTSEALTIPASLCGKAALTTIDDIPAYPNNCGDVNVWSNDGRTTQTHAGTGAGWVQTEGGYGYQCTELAVRYTHFLFGTASHWGIAEAKDMCGTHPSDLKATSAPVHGDLMVFAANDCVGAAGHVAVVSSTSGSTVSVVQQNEGSTGKGSYSKSCAACFLHAARNNVCGDKANGAYCGDTTAFAGGTKGTLYTCNGYAVKSSTACKYGCEAVTNASDECASAPEDAGDAATDAMSHDASDASAAPEGDSGSTNDGPSAPSSGGCTISAPSSRAFGSRIVAFGALVVIALVRRRRGSARGRFALAPVRRR
jgi:hypothetical protein